MYFMNLTYKFIQYVIVVKCSLSSLKVHTDSKRVRKMATIVQAFMVVLAASALLNFHSCHGFDKKLQ